MAFLLQNSNFSSRFRSHSQKTTQDALSPPRRAFHVEPGAREKALLADDPALRRFKSNKKGIKAVKRVGDVLTIAIVAGCCYEMYVRASMREAARKQAGETA